MVLKRDLRILGGSGKESFLPYGAHSDASLVDKLMIGKPRSLVVKVSCRLRFPPLQSKSKGQDLFDQIMYHIDLVESDYFGMQFMDTEHVSVRNPVAA